MRVLFLDVDGVLTTHRCLGSVKDYDYDDPSLFFATELGVPCAAADDDDSSSGSGVLVPLERAMMGQLAWLLRELPDLRVVLTSTWRQQAHMRAYLLAAMAAMGIDVHTAVVGDTPTLSPLEGRGAEVTAWLDAQQDVVDSFAIVDDDHAFSWARAGLTARWVETAMSCPHDRTLEGLTRTKAAALLALLRPVSVDLC
jgi:hypothetical protein